MCLSQLHNELLGNKLVTLAGFPNLFGYDTYAPPELHMYSFFQTNSNAMEISMQTVLLQYH